MYRVRTGITGGPGGPFLSTMFFDVIGGLTAANANAAAGAFWTAIKAVSSSALTFTTESEVATVDIATGQVTGLLPVTPISVVGVDPADPLPFATQALIRWHTGVFTAGREIRGRTFVPGATEQYNVSGVPRADYKAALDAAATTLIGAVGAELMTYSRKNHDAAPVISGSTWSEWAVLRSRRP